MEIVPETTKKAEQLLEKLPSLFFPQQYHHHAIQDFTSDDDEEGELSLQLGVGSSDSDDDEECCDFSNSKASSKSRRGRRKPLLPQKTVQSEISSSAGTSSECSQDAIMLNFADSFVGDDEHFLELADGDDLLQDIDEENIFKGIQEETGGEKIDDEIIDNVKEEWRTHWGIKCNMCEQLFPYKADFDKHYLDNYALSPVYTCTFCNKTADKYSTFRSHCYRHITEGRYKCKDCPKGFSLQSMLHVHILAKHTKAKPFSCEECGKTFVTKPGLKIHMKKHKCEVKEEYACVECGKVLHTRGGLTSHMNVHRLGRRFMCDICGKTFTQKVNMQQHVKQHTGDKPHGCDKCGKTFAEKSHLARHYSFHSENRPYKCEVCQKMYKTERCLKVHSLVHAAARPFVCKYCSKGFLSSTKLKQHSNIHTGERPYKCKYCERTFTNYPNWLKHTRRRHKVDHKTGEELPPKQTPKLETEEEIVPQQPQPQTSVSVAAGAVGSSVAATETAADPLLADFATFSKSEEFLLQQNLLNIPLDDKFILQQIDFINGSPSNSRGFFMPYLQSHHQALSQQANQAALSLQLGDIIPVHYLHSLNTCDSM